MYHPTALEHHAGFIRDLNRLRREAYRHQWTPLDTHQAITRHIFASRLYYICPGYAAHQIH